MQAVTTSAGAGIVEGDLQVVVAEEPIERGPGFFAPARVFGDAIGLQIGGNGGAGFDGLLIEAGFLGFLGVEAERAYWDEVAFVSAALHCRLPIEGFYPGCYHGVICAASACTN